jgi:hypothetical protein
VSNYLLRTLAQAEGYCCEITYFASFQGWSNTDLAAHIGVHKKTIQRTRRRIKCGDITCPGECKNLVKYYDLCQIRAKKIIRAPEYLRPSYITETQALEHCAREMWIAHFRTYAEEKTDEDPGYLRALSAYRILAKPALRVPVRPGGDTTLEVPHTTACDGDSEEGPAD